MMAAASLAACSNEIELVEARKEIPVVYGLLSPKDTANYIRVERAFGSNTTSAIDLAKNIDSLYYKDIIVQLERVSNRELITLNQVDGSKEGYKRQAGVFAENPNFLYKTKANIVDNEAYKLIVKRKDGTVLTESQTNVPSNMQFVSGQTLTGTGLTLSVISGFRLYWSSKNIDFAKMYDINMIVELLEIPKDGSASTTRKLTWEVANSFVPVPGNGDVIPSTNTVSHRVKDGQAFYRFLANNLDANKAAIRKITSLKFEVTSAGNELYNYIEVGNINTGITGTEVLPTYSNIKNGYGIFSARNNFVSESVRLNERSLDSLFNGSITKKLGFIN